MPLFLRLFHTKEFSISAETAKALRELWRLVASLSRRAIFKASAITSAVAAPDATTTFQAASRNNTTCAFGWHSAQARDGDAHATRPNNTKRRRLLSLLLSSRLLLSTFTSGLACCH